MPKDRGLLHRFLYHVLPDPYWTRYSLWKVDRHYAKQKPAEQVVRPPRRTSSSRKVSRAESNRQEMRALAKEQDLFEPAERLKARKDFAVSLKEKIREYELENALPDVAPIRYYRITPDGEKCYKGNIDPECWCQECREALYQSERRKLPASIRWGVYSDGIVKAGTTIAEWYAKVGVRWNVPPNADAFLGTKKLGWQYTIQGGDHIEFHRPMGERY